MNLKKKFVLFTTLLFLIISNTACNIGLGKEIDQEPPVITITSHTNFAKVGLSFDLCGTCTDNEGITKVVVENLNTNIELSGVVIDKENNTWKCPVSLTKDQEGEIVFSCTAFDAASNSGTESSKNISLLVDSTAPEDLSWYIDRGNGIQTPLENLQTLKTMDLSLSENKDYPQNQEFTINARFYDAISINEITVNLVKEDNTVLVSKTVSSDESNTNFIGNTSIFTPKFKFTQSELESADSSFVSGKHYLKITYSCKDDHGNPSSKELDWMLWYPESDIPGITQSFAVNSTINTSVKTSLPINLFDDDGLSEYKCGLLQQNTFTVMRGAVELEQAVKLLETDESFRDKVFSSNLTVPATESVKSDKALGGTRDTFISITAPSIPSDMYLITCVKDVNGTWKAIILPTYVTDANAPLLYIQNPKENEVPVLDANKKFKISGYTLDSNGCANVKIVYIPDSSDNAAAEATAKQILDADTTADNSSKLDYPNGVKLWNYKLGEGTNDPSTNWIKQTYEFDFGLLDTKIFAEGKRKEAKFFELLVIDTDGNKVYRQFKIDGDTIAPTLEVLYPEADMAIHDYSQTDLKIIFKAKKDTGIGINTSKYALKIDGVSTSLEDDSANPGYKTATITKDKLQTKVDAGNNSVKLYFYAEDELGNKVEDNRTVILSSLPTLESVSSDMVNGTYKIGDKIKIKAKYSQVVYVTKTDGTPKIELQNVTPTRYAEYSTGSGTDTLIFEYIVQEGDNSTQIKLPPKPIILNGGKIGPSEGTSNANTDTVTLTSSTNSFMGDTPVKQIAIDGNRPTISGITVTAKDSGGTAKTDVKADDIITATVTMSEPINVSGSPDLKLKAGSDDIKLTFQSVSGNSIIFEYVVSGKNGVLKTNKNTAFNFTEKLFADITDVNGNWLKQTTDTDTNTSITIDTGKPNPPTIKGIVAGDKNTTQNFTVEGETDAVFEYSTDDGITWKDYTAQVSLGNGKYDITARQTDKAGNISDKATTISLTINNVFPTITGLSINVTDGFYNQGKKITAKMSFDGYVKDVNVGQIALTFTDKDGNNPKTMNVSASSGKTNSLIFEYTVSDTDNFDGVYITDVNFNGIKDENGNGKTSLTTEEESLLEAPVCKRDGIHLDGILPSISTYTPAMTTSEGNPVSGISTEKDNSKFKITLKFSENVYKETGNIILQRKGKWAIPPVLTADEFTKYYEKMDATSKGYMMKTDSNGQEVYHGRTGIAVGPYRKITHGLIESGGEVIPDENTKYVLAYELGLYDGEASLNNGTEEGTFKAKVSDIRSALESVDYHRHYVDVASDNVSITGETVEITFSETIEDGREWELIIPPTSFRDNAENFYKGMNLDKLKDAEKTDLKITTDQQEASDKYSVWSNNVAIPVVRVDRYSHGWGANEPYLDGTEIKTKTITVNNRAKDGSKYAKTRMLDNSAAKIAPTGYCRARIDCETPGVTINYKQINKGSVKYTDAAGNFTEHKKDTSNTKSSTSGIGNATKNDLEFTSGGQTAISTTEIIVGDGLYTSARKDYISAYAEKTDFEKSGYGYEGVFKTVVYVESKTENCLNIEGGTAPGGQPNVSGFPLRDATDDTDSTGAGRYSKNAYCIDNGYAEQVWVTYEIISSDWAILICRTNHAQEYPISSYGQVCKITYIKDYSNQE